MPPPALRLERIEPRRSSRTPRNALRYAQQKPLRAHHEATPLECGHGLSYLHSMNIRQERFAELVASGMSATRAYAEAGYSGQGKNAEAHASRLVENGGVSARIAELRKESRELARMSKTAKLRLLEAIAVSETARNSDRISAIRVHNDMTGDNEPERMVVETGPTTLANIKERVASVISGLNRVQCSQ